MEKLTERIELKLAASTFAALESIEAAHGLSPQVVCRKLADAVADYFQKNGRFGFPVILTEGDVKPSTPVRIEAAPSKTKSAKDEKKLHRAQQKLTMDADPRNKLPAGTKKRIPHSSRVSARNHSDAKHEDSSKF